LERTPKIAISVCGGVVERGKGSDTGDVPLEKKENWKIKERDSK